MFCAIFNFQTRSSTMSINIHEGKTVKENRNYVDFSTNL